MTFFVVVWKLQGTLITPYWLKVGFNHNAWFHFPFSINLILGLPIWFPINRLVL